MWQSARDAYLEEKVLSADPLELIRLLHQAALAAVREARHHLAAGRIRERSRAISKASEIVVELAASLDHERGQDLSRRLARLYDYLLRRLTEANLSQTDAPLVDVLGILTTLSEAWEGLRQNEPAAPRPGEWARVSPLEAVAARAAQAWSF